MKDTRNSGRSKSLVWVPWIRWENNEVQCAPVGLETIEAVKEYAEKRAAENGMSYVIV